MSWYSNLIRKMRNKEITSVNVNELIEACDILNDGGNPLLRNNSYYHFVYMANALTGLMNNNATNLSAAMSKSKSFAKGDDVTLDDEQKAKLNALLECAVTESNGSLTLKGCSKMNSLVDVINKAKEKAEKEKQEEEEKLKKEAEKMAEEAAKKATEEEVDTKEDTLIDEMLKCPALKGHMTDIAEKLTDLYKSNLTGIPHEGLLMPNGSNSPLWQYKSGKGEIAEKPTTVADTGTFNDMTICNIVAKQFPSLGVYKKADPKTGFPSYNDLMSGDCYMLEAQLMFQTANVRLSGHVAPKNSINHWNTLAKAGIDTSKTRINDVKKFGQWIKWVLERQYCRYIIEALGAETVKKINDAGGTEWFSKKQLIESVQSMFCKSLRNVLAVVERRPNSSGEKMETTKISTLATGIDLNKIAELLMAEGALNIGGSKTVKVQTEFNSKAEIGTITIAYNGKFEEANIYSGNIVDKLVEAGVKTTWDNVLIGRDQNGNLVYYNMFKGGPSGEADASKYFYTIYGGSGSGKGNMTLSLLAAALSDNCKVFYTDGKPDSGYSFGIEAWKDGKEAFVFDGQPRSLVKPFDAAHVQFEQMPIVSGMRSNSETEVALDKLPGELFVGEQGARQEATLRLLGVTRYLRGIEFWQKSLTSNTNRDNWGVYVFDEITSMNANELEVRQMMYNRASTLVQNEGIKASTVLETGDASYNGKVYTVLRGISFAKVSPKEIDKVKEAFEKHPALKYIRSWITWANSLMSKIGDIIVIAGRQSCQTTFIIFQNAVWFAGSAIGKSSATTIHSFASSVGGISTKFIGRNALANACGVYGMADQVKSAWYTTFVNSEKAYWAVTKGSAVPVDSSEVTVFKPFSCWGFVQDLQNVLCDENTKNYKRYFHYYISRLMETVGRSAGDVVNDTYNYANQFIAEHESEFDLAEGSGDAIKRFIYNAYNFASVEADVETGAVGAGEAGENGGETGDSQPFGGWGSNSTPVQQTSQSSEQPTVSSFGPANFDESSIKTKEDAEAVNEAIASSTEQRYEQRSAQLKTQIEKDPWAMANSSVSTDEMVDFQGEVEVEAFDADGDGIPDAEDDFFGPGTLSDQNISTTINNDMGDNESGHVGMDGVDLTEEQINLANSDFTQPVAQKSKEQHITTDKNGKVNMDAARLQKGTQVVKVNNSNFIPVNSAYMPPSKMDKVLNSERKYRKFVHMVADSFIDDIGKAVGGRLMVRTLLIQNSGMLVNNEKIVKSDMLQYLDNSMQEIVNFEDIFSEFSNLTMLMLDKAMYSVFLEQITPCITEKDMAEGISDPAYFVLKYKAKLNEIQVKDVGVFRKAELLEKERKENLKALQEKQAEYARQMVRNRMDSAKRAKKMKVQTRTDNTPSRAAKRRAALVSGGRGFGRGVWKLTKGIGRGLFKLFT